MQLGIVGYGGLLPPDAPTSLAITGASGGVVADLTPTITFTAAPTSTSHKVQWSTASDFSTVTGEATIAMPTAEYTHTVALANHYEYNWRVAGINAGGQGTWSDVLTVHVSVFTQALGSELLTNGDFGTGDLTGWTVAGTSPPDDTVTVASNKVTIKNTTLAPQAPRIEQNVMTADHYYEGKATGVTYAVYQYWQFRDGTGGFSWATVKSATEDVGLAARANYSTLQVLVFGAPVEFTVDDVSLKEVTLNAAVTAAADGTFEFHYTLPGTEKELRTAELWYRGSDSLNYWRARVQHNLDAWQFSLAKMVAGAVTTKFTVNTIGVTNAIRVVASGNDHTCYTSADGGDNWTQRGTTQTDSAMASNTDVRAFYQSEITPVKVVRP